ATMSRMASASLDLRVLGFSVVLSVATAFVFGLVPAIRASRINLQASIHGDTRKTAHAPTSIARQVLVAADVALAVVLLIGAGLMIKSVGRLLDVHPGFDPDHVLRCKPRWLANPIERTKRWSPRRRRWWRRSALCRASRP